MLLYLIRKNEINIYDIPIAEITRQYLEYLHLMQVLDLEIAGEFIEMVATLMLIKVRMLLPSSSIDAEEELEDPRAQLVYQLLEYKRFKEAAEQLRVAEEQRLKEFPRQPETIRISRDDEEDELLIEASLFDLLTAFKEALDNMPRQVVHQVHTPKITIEEQVAFVIERLQGRKYLLFSELVKELNSRLRLIVTFMAILDLIQAEMLTARQPEIFGEIRLIPKGELTMRRYLALRPHLDNNNVQIEPGQ